MTRQLVKFSIRAAPRAAALLLLALSPSSLLAQSQPSAAPAAAPAPAAISSSGFSDAARVAAHSDPVLDAMIAEIERSKAKLKMDGVQAPYFIEYRVSDLIGDSATAIFGASQLDQKSHARIMRVVVRVGDYKQDSYFRNGLGIVDFAPYENDILAMREELWAATDRAYKAAGEAYAAKQSLAKQITLDPTINDFAPSTPLVDIEPLATLEADSATWRKTLEDASALYRKYPEVQSVSVALKFTAINDYYVNTEGSVTRRGEALYSLESRASTQAPDGMRLARSPYVMVADPKELPTTAKFVADMDAALKTLNQLRDAPIVDEEYRGPVLFDADASSDVFADLVGSNVLGVKPEPGATARTTGEFASSYKSRVLPDFVTVIDDPTRKTFDGHSLIGAYDFDDEGVKAAPITVVDKGTLTNYLLGRLPIRDFPASNGHGRATPGGQATPKFGNLFLNSTNAMPLADLKKKLIDMCRDQGKPYGYFVETLGEELSPRLLYRIWVNDGHEELVRGAVFNELDTRSIRSDLIATGDKPEVWNREGQIAETVITPALLFDELEVKRADTAKDKLPEYPPPPLKSAQ
ncbi:MAG: metallopeptidase TldD-related protein [Candidatus Acidiferrales bacterium]